MAAMSQTHSPSDKGVFSATVSSNRQIERRFYKLKLQFLADAARAFARFKPGQFAQIDLSGTALPPEQDIPADLLDASRREILLRRPFSFADVTVEGDETAAELLYCVVGPATLRMTTLSSGDSVSIIGPLGNGFRVPADKKTALFVVGGMGAPPLQHLAKTLTTEHSKIEVVAFAGAKTVSDLPFEGTLDEISQQLGFWLTEFARHGINSLVATDDGSAGYRGLVTDRLQKWLDEESGVTCDDVIIYACGPEAMLAKVAEIAREKRIDCQISMERRMACGIGLCQSCAVECKVEGSAETTYRLCCEDGPVFDSHEVVFA